MTKEKKEEGAEAAPAGKAGEKPRPRATRKRCRWRQKGRGQARSQGREEEIIFAAQAASPAHGANASHRGSGQSGRGLREDAPQRRFFAGRKTGGAMEVRAGRTNGSFEARVARAERGGKKVLLAEPQTFMNLSGESVGALVKFYQLPLAQIVGGGGRCGFAVGRNPVAAGGSSGGHHGLESVEQHLGARNLRGCGSASGAKTKRGRSPVMCSANSSAAENALLEKVLERAAGQLECWLSAGLQKAMSQFNGVVDSTNEEK